MKIVIVDAYTVSHEDLDMTPFESLGEVISYPRTDPSETYERCKDADAIITSKVVFDRSLIARLPKLKYIGVIATGFNNIDLKAARERNIPVTNVPLYCAESVAQITFSHILEHTNRLGHYNRVIKEENKWCQSKDFAFWDHPIIELNGKTLGLIGCGHIGQMVAKIGHSFGMQVQAYDKFAKRLEFVKYLDQLDGLFRASDFISLHCPLTNETKEIINKENLAKMKNSAFIINTSRGPLVNEEDLSIAINEGRIAGAGLDVLKVEPPKPDNLMLNTPNCHISPHIGFASIEARARLIQMTADNLRAFINSNPQNIVN